MTQSPFQIASLNPEDLEELKRLEERMSERTGHDISLIAYESLSGDGDKSE